MAFPGGASAFPTGGLRQNLNQQAQQRFVGRAEAEQQGQVGQQMMQQAQTEAEQAP